MPKGRSWGIMKAIKTPRSQAASNGKTILKKQKVAASMDIAPTSPHRLFTGRETGRIRQMRP
jgi:hypothetical protein